ncbi:hypothetical protein pdam_00018094, partial [Pocillopora damicornis]
TSALKCNYDYDLLDLDNHLLAFYKQIIFYWQDVATATPKNKNEVLSQPIWTFFLLFPKIERKHCKKVPKTQLRLPPQFVHCHARQYIVCCLTLKIYLHQLLRKKLLASGVEKSDD